MWRTNPIATPVVAHAEGVDVLDADVVGTDAVRADVVHADTVRADAVRTDTMHADGCAWTWSARTRY